MKPNWICVRARLRTHYYFLFFLDQVTEPFYATSQPVHLTEIRYSRDHRNFLISPPNFRGGPRMSSSKPLLSYTGSRSSLAKFWLIIAQSIMGKISRINLTPDPMPLVRSKAEAELVRTLDQGSSLFILTHMRLLKNAYEQTPLHRIA